MVASNLYDNSGSLVALGRKLGTGGEGSVFEVPAVPSLVAKVYHKAQDSRKAEKLRAMVRLAVPDLLKVAAWPTATLHDRPAGPVVGLVMPKIAGFKEVHTLYSPAHRKKDFPQADWAFLIHTAVNCAVAFEAIHRCGHVIGDVNQSNVLVSAQATVGLIDCDSYQVNANGQLFPCDVGVPLYTAPELQGHNLRGLVRSHNHDRFGLAVLVFHLLFMGRHPFSGRYLGRGDMPLERAIGEYRFAFGRAAGGSDMAPPVHSLPLSAVTPDLARLFERAFSKVSLQPNARPTAAEWIAALNAFKKQLKACSFDPGHKFAAHASVCPWCDLMHQGAPNFFVAVSVYHGISGLSVARFTLAAVWDQIERVPAPRSGYQRPPVGSASVAPSALPADVPIQMPKRVVVSGSFLQKMTAWTAACAGVLIVSVALSRALGLFSFVTCLVFAVWWLILETMRRAEEKTMNAELEQGLKALQRERRRRTEAYEHAREGLANAEAHWNRVASNHVAYFAAKKKELQALKDWHVSLRAGYDADYRQLQAGMRSMQFAQFLQQQFISDHQIPGIGTTREAVLRSYGIETAYDVNQQTVLEVPGFGPALTTNLVQWRQQVEGTFRFDPSIGIPESEIRALNLKYRQLQQGAELQLQKGPSDLKAISSKAEQQLSQLLDQVRPWVKEVAQAQADLSVLPR